MIHSVAIAWSDLLGAFSNMEQDRVYFFDRMTGEIFSVRSDSEDSFWDELEHQQGRFLEIPCLDVATERTLINGFLAKQANQELRSLLDHALSGRPPYAKSADILSFFPDEERQLAELRDTFVSDRVKHWLEENELFSMSTSLSAVH
ncbi:MAG: UPF0158 family protein [Geobacter sp.]|nr:UPF0158 family protein [Geobacter sp.]